jgi:dihydroorotase
MEYAASNDLTVFLYPEDAGLANGGCAHEGVVSTRLGLPGIPAAAETQAVADYLMLIEQTGVRAHFCHLSTAKAVHMIGRAQYDGYGITANVTAHHLHLTEMDLGYFNANCHLRPPLRTDRDRDALRQAVAEGKIEAISSDHQPHDADAKLAPFAETEPGISALETLLPLSLRLVQDGLMKLPQLIERLTLAPADILGLNVGRLHIGTPGDVCIFDPKREWTLRESDLTSHGHNTPFIGWPFTGRVTRTLLGGRTVFELADR